MACNNTCYVSHAPVRNAFSLSKVHSCDDDDEKERKETNGCVRVLFVMVLVLLILSVIGIVISVMIMNGKKDNREDKDKDNEWNRPDPWPMYPDPKHCPECKEPEKPPHPTFVIGVGSDWGTFDRLSSDNYCKLDGWNQAVVEAACDAAEISCEVMLVPYGDCIQNPPHESSYKDPPKLGPGIYYKGIDACSGWFGTEERKNSALFSEPYIARQRNFLFFSETFGAPVNVQSARIAFNYKVPADEKCLLRFLSDRLGFDIDPENLIPSPSESDSLDKLMAQEVQLVFSNRRDIVLSQHEHQGYLEIYDVDGNGSSGEDDHGNYMYCSPDGGLITHKRNAKILEKFNDGLAIIRSNGIYHAICRATQYNTYQPTPAHHTWCVQ